MAGKKGMKQARPRTQAERDTYALGRIEHLIDKLAENTMLKCAECASEIPWKDIPPQAVTLLKARYDKLRATKTETEVTHKTSFIDALKRIEQADKLIPNGDGIDDDSQSNHTPRVTH